MNRLTLVVMIAAIAIMDVLAGKYLQPGLSGELTEGAVITGVAMASTNATQTATVKAVYEWPVYGTVTESTTKPVEYFNKVDKVETLTNWCDYATSTSVTNISGSVTNVVYYDGITVATNLVLQKVTRIETNTVTKTAVVGKVAITNSLYSLTASGGVATNGEKRIVGGGARLLIENAPVTIFTE